MAIRTQTPKMRAQFDRAVDKATQDGALSPSDFNQLLQGFKQFKAHNSWSVNLFGVVGISKAEPLDKLTPEQRAVDVRDVLASLEEERPNLAKCLKMGATLNSTVDLEKNLMSDKMDVSSKSITYY